MWTIRGSGWLKFGVILLLLCDQVLSFLTTEVELSPGTHIVGLRKKDYDAFYGIPFARPPVGNLRFRDPVPSPWWTGYYKAIIPKLYCWQFDSVLFPIPVSGTEDCLYLNIYRPRIVASDQPLSVLVNIHGGGFYSGNTLPLVFGPDYFMATGQVIFVTIAYRLSVFGFMATGDEASPGNYGLKDQTLALKWLKLHIGAFGGDPDSVTIMGQSAGSLAVNYHLASKLSVGLFKNAIMMSGTVDAPWGKPLERPRKLVNRHAKALGIKNATQLDSKELVEMLRSIPAKNLTRTVRDLYRWDVLPLTAYLPVVEPLGTPDPFLTVDPRISIARGDFIKVPVMASIVHGDGIPFVQPFLRWNSRYQELNREMYKILPLLLEMSTKHPNITQIVDRVRSKYLGSTGGLVTPESFDRLLRLATDYHFGRPLYTTCQALARYTPVYVHKFDYRGLLSSSLFYTKTLRNYGVVHVDEMLYLFRLWGVLPYQLTPQDERVQKVFLKHVISFIKFGHPGYPAWDVNEPMLTRFRRSERGDLVLDQVPVKKHEFWRDIQDLYESPWRGQEAGNFTQWS